MKIYKDASLTKPVDILDLGIVQADDSKEYLFYVYNDTKADLKNLKFKISHKEVEILDAPKTIDSKSLAKLKIKWSPSLTLKEGLKTKIEIKGVELWS